MQLKPYLLPAALACAVSACGGGGGGGGSTTGTTANTASLNTASCDARTGAGPALIQLERAFPNLLFSEPVALLASAAGDRFYVVEKAGRIRSFANDDTATTTVTLLDLRDQVDARAEGGLLGMALDPDFDSNGFVYLSYTGSDDPVNDNGDNFRSLISRFSVTMPGSAIDPASEAILLNLPQSFSNHNGGQIEFGPDGYLYIGFGDEGGSGDPADNAQNEANLYGAMLRIDVSGPDVLRNQPYRIPPGNPYADSLSCSDGACPEIFAFGLRNPWRWSFDRATGDLWAGDVGQNDREEIDRIEIGGNYGWRCLEGTAEFNSATCENGQFEPPVAEYEHSEGGSVTGGYVYRGSAVVALDGVYVFGDFLNGRIWGLSAPYSDSPDCRLLLDTDVNISSFAEDSNGEILVIDFSGELYRISP